MQWQENKDIIDSWRTDEVSLPRTISISPYFIRQLRCRINKGSFVVKNTPY